MATPVFNLSNITNKVVTTVVTTMPEVKSNRCMHSECRKKLLLSDMACKCTNRYCISHRHPETHSCAFDYNKEGIQRLSTMLVKVTNDSLKNRV